MSSTLIVELLRMFIRLSEPQFAAPSEPLTQDDPRPGWRRGDGDGLQWWVRPAAWRGIFEPHDIDPVEAARTVKALGLLHEQANDTLQSVVMVGKPAKSTRAYVVDGAGLAAWKAPTGPDYRTYRETGAKQQFGGLSGGLPAPTSPNPALLADPANLAAMLQQGTALALAKGVELLGMSPDPQDRNFSSILRAQTSFANSMVTTQVRVDEAQLRQKHHDALLRMQRLIEEERERQRRLGY